MMRAVLEFKRQMSPAGCLLYDSKFGMVCPCDIVVHARIRGLPYWSVVVGIPFRVDAGEPFAPRHSATGKVTHHCGVGGIAQ